MKAYDVFQAIGEPKAFGGMPPPFWEEAMAVMPRGTPAFLNPDWVPARRAAAGLRPDRDAWLAGLAGTVSRDPALRALAWYLHWRVFLEPQRAAPGDAPPLERRLGDRAGAFYLLLALEFPARLRAAHRNRGYPEAVTEATLRQVGSFESYHLGGRGVPGIYNGQFVWLAKYLIQPFVRLGRFEYQMDFFAGGISVWEQRRDGSIVALAADGARFAHVGLGLLPRAPDDAGWTATCERTPDAVKGYPIDPSGRVLRAPVWLERSLWRPRLKNGDVVLNLHIPPGGGMAWEAVAASFRQALDFFARYHAGHPFSALVTNTWFADPRLTDLLPPDSNVARFQRTVYLYPSKPNPGSLWFVFLRDMQTTVPAELPRETSLQHILADFLQNGGVWHGGGMFILPEDMRRPGEGCYRRRFGVLQPRRA